MSRTWLRQRNIAHTIPEHADQIATASGAAVPAAAPHVGVIFDAGS
ncbi:hypothetical protein [Streptomyces sp. NPDC057682]